MVNLQLTFPDWAFEFIQEQVATGGYKSADEYLPHLIDRARTVTSSDGLADQILEGENSGEGYEFTDENWTRRMAELRAEADRRRSA
jgi:antitoxin ParD1/3/4